MDFLGYRCDACEGSFGPEEVTYTCAACGGNLFVRMDLSGVDRDRLCGSGERSMWRYASLLPVPTPSEETGPLRNVGGTPLYRADRAATALGVKRLWLKDDGRMPTGSLKDRASAVVVQRAREIGADRIITASTGNAGVALAAMARAAGVEAVVLVPESAPAAKIAKLQIFGATLFLVRGTYDDAFRLSEEASRELGWYCRNTGRNPFTVEGKKTVAFEIAEELNWKLPGRIFVSVGDGNILVAVHKGLTELLELGWIDCLPRIMGVQAEGSAPIARAFEASSDRIEPVRTDTLADSIAAGDPSDGARALRAVRATGGAFLTVSDEEILGAIVSLGREASVFAEPAAAAAYAGLSKALSTGMVDPEEEALVLITGTGLNDVLAAERAMGETAPVIEPTLAALRKALAQ